MSYYVWIWSISGVQMHIVRDDAEHILDEDHILVEEYLEFDEISIAVSWNDCDMAEYFCAHNSSTILEYTVEISPETEVLGA